MNDRHRRSNSPPILLFLLFITTIAIVAMACYALFSLLAPFLQRDWGPQESRLLHDDQRRLVASMEQIRRYRHKYLGALGLPANATIAVLPQVLQRANLTLRDQLLLEPIVLQLVQWGYFDKLLTDIPGWIQKGIDMMSGKNEYSGRLDKSEKSEKSGKFLRDRYNALQTVGKMAIDTLQQNAIGLKEVNEQGITRINDNFEEEHGVVKIVAHKNSHIDYGNGTWIDTVKHDIGDLVKQIESSGGDVFSKLHKAGLAHLETVIRLPGEDEGQLHPNDEATHRNVTGHSAGSIIDPYNNRFVLSRPSNLAMVGEDGKFLVELLSLLVGSIILGMLFEICSLPVFLGYIFAGILLGPSCLDMIQNLMQINTFGQFCLLMIVCSLGLEFSLDKIQAVWMISLLGTLLMGMASSLLSCIIGIYLFQVSFQQSLFVGLILSLSSTVVAVKCLQSSGDKGVIGTIVGKSVMGVLVAQDLLFCIALAILPVFASGHAGTWNFVKTVIIFVFKTTTFTISVMLVSRLIANIAPWAMFDHLRVIGFVALATITGHYFGVSVELGVFLAAMAVSTFTPADHPVYHALHETRDQRIVTLSEFASIFFFASIGLLLDMRFLWGELFLLVPFSLFIVIVKATATALIMKMLSLEWRHAITVGVDLAQVSELALLLGARGRRLGLITGESYYVLAGVTALGMILAPILWRFTNCIDTGMKRREMECI